MPLWLYMFLHAGTDGRNNRVAHMDPFAIGPVRHMFLQPHIISGKTISCEVLKHTDGHAWQYLPALGPFPLAHLPQGSLSAALSKPCSESLPSIFERGWSLTSFFSQLAACSEAFTQAGGWASACSSSSPVCPSA